MSEALRTGEVNALLGCSAWLAAVPGWLPGMKLAIGPQAFCRTSWLLPSMLVAPEAE